MRLYKNLNFLGANIMMFILGIMLFSSLVMMPLYLQTLMGYTAESAGLVLSGGGLILLFLMPIAGTLSSKVQARYLIAFGWLALALAMFYTTKWPGRDPQSNVPGGVTLKNKYHEPDIFGIVSLPASVVARTFHFDSLWRMKSSVALIHPLSEVYPGVHYGTCFSPQLDNI